MMRKKLLLSLLVLLSLVLVACKKEETEKIVVTEKILTKEEYYNKTLAGILGQITGFLTGYEFVWEAHDKPRINLPDHWFDLLNGPYAGNYTYYAPGPDYYDKYTRFRFNNETQLWEVYSDDDYHVDFFNQLILSKSLPYISSKAILDNWLEYQVRDWGGGHDAMRIMNNDNLLPPYTGLAEYGNRYNWATEPYIENETLGMNAPGMPNLAIDLTDKFATVTGDFEGVMWAKFYAAMYSLAYFESDIIKILDEAKEVLPEGSWPRKMYDISLEAYHNNKRDWRKAGEIVEAYRRYINGIDNVQVATDINGAFAILSLLYGNGDYIETAKISSLLGYDGDCTAAIVLGIVGIINGMEGTPEKVIDKLYQNGEVIYVNDTFTGFPPYIARNYPERQKLTDIVKLYQENFEILLLREGGKIEEDKYIIPTTKIHLNKTYILDNHDFELGTLKYYQGNSDSGKPVDATIIEGTEVHSGKYAAKLYSSGENTNAQLYRTVDNLEVGSYYRVTAYIKTSLDTEVRLFAKGSNKILGIIPSGEEYYYASVYNAYNYVSRSLIFKANNKKMDIGIEIPEGYAQSKYGVIDNVLIEKLTYQPGKIIKEDKTVKEVINFNIKEFDEKHEKLLILNFSNNNGKIVYATIHLNDEVYGKVPIYPTGNELTYSMNIVEIPIVISKRNSEVKIYFSEAVGINYIEVNDRYVYQIR